MKGINIDDNNKRYLSYQIKWFGIYIGVGLSSVDTAAISYIIFRILGGFPYY